MDSVCERGEDWEGAHGLRRHIEPVGRGKRGGNVRHKPSHLAHETAVEPREDVKREARSVVLPALPFERGEPKLRYLESA